MSRAWRWEYDPDHNHLTGGLPDHVVTEVELSAGQLVDPAGMGIDDLNSATANEPLADRPPGNACAAAPGGVSHRRDKVREVTTGSSKPVFASGWVLEANLRPLCEVVSDLIGYDFDDADWRAVEHGLPGTDDDRPATDWFLYPLVGRTRVDLRVAQAVGGSVVSIQLLGTADDTLTVQAGTVIRVLSQYGVRDGPAP
ncbi:MAG: hypothetical protein HOY79_14415 [Streptomyces sp.]|nr:hypothetical protein [Streptomyces sp.]